MSHDQQTGSYGGYGGYQDSQNTNVEMYNPPPQYSDGDAGGFHEMQNLTGGDGDGQPLSVSDFLGAARALQDDIVALEHDETAFYDRSAHALSRLEAAGGDGEADGAKRLADEKVAFDLRRRDLRARLDGLRRDAEHTPGPAFGTKKQHWDNVRAAFSDATQRAMQAGQRYQRATQDRFARQYRFVNPDASDEQVIAAMDTSDGSGVFQQTILQSARNQAVREQLLERHANVAIIEQQMHELGKLSRQLAEMVVQQEPMVAHVEANAAEAVDHLEQGNAQVGTATKHARRLTRNKWWCILIVCLIVLAIALGVGLGVYFSNKSSKKATGQ